MQQPQSSPTATLRAGVPMRQIAGMLGHTDTKTTERHDAKHAPEFLADAANALDDLFVDREPPQPQPDPERIEHRPVPLLPPPSDR